MALLRIVEEKKTLSDKQAIEEYLGMCGLRYEYWLPDHPVEANAAAEEILKAYAKEIEKLKELGGYVTADVIDVNARTPDLDSMLAKFNREHWHDEDEVRFIISGRGLFHIRPKESSVVAIEVEPGDLLLVPKGTWHWFDLCSDRQIRAIRLFQDPAGWTPLYTGSGIDRNFEPLCFGPSHFPSDISNTS
jgi:1,2-dihydroxy-3-keto-5-methylthiopentene dioxygenase